LLGDNCRYRKWGKGLGKAGRRREGAANANKKKDLGQVSLLRKEISHQGEKWGGKGWKALSWKGGAMNLRGGKKKKEKRKIGNPSGGGGKKRKNSKSFSKRGKEKRHRQAEGRRCRPLGVGSCFSEREKESTTKSRGGGRKAPSRGENTKLTSGRATTFRRLNITREKKEGT